MRIGLQEHKLHIVDLSKVKGTEWYPFWKSNHLLIGFLWIPRGPWESGRCVPYSSHGYATEVTLQTELFLESKHKSTLVTVLTKKL